VTFPEKSDFGSVTPSTSTRNWDSSYTRSPTACTSSRARGSSRNRTGYPCFTIAAQEPEGETMYPSPGKESRNFRAMARASFRFPELKAGCPQHVCERGTRTVAPNRSRTSTAAKAVRG
jgi:hypothetical protein